MSNGWCLCLFLVSNCLVSELLSTGVRLPKRRCIGGHRHGARVDLTRYWYHCNDGKLENRGCFAANRKRLKLRQLYVSENFEVQCVEDEAGLLRLRYTACFMDGVKYEPGSDWSGGPGNATWYRCQLEGPILRMNVGGCLKADGERMNLNSEFVEDSVIYKCASIFRRRTSDSTDNFATTEPVGCMHYAKRYQLGEVFEDDSFWYTCAQYKARGKIKGVKEVNGCTHYNHRIRPDDRYVINDVIIQCKLRPFPAHEPVGCLRQLEGRRLPQLIGSQWIKGTPPYQYVMQCNKKGDKRAAMDYRACLFSEEKGGTQFAIEPGCFTVMGKDAIACRKHKDGSLAVEKFKNDQLHVAYRMHVRYCRPKLI